jgi:uncharacterized protein YqjF (DUF2071 family)
MLNYEVDPAVLAGRVPRGTEIDQWNGRTYLSVVGFLFLDTRVMGLAIPFHRNFEEVNLRFYVRHKAADGWRRGVVFVKELVPRSAIAFVARTLYNENYVAVPMGHEIGQGGTGTSVAYEWSLGGRSHRLFVSARGEPRPLVPGSEEEFIAEHYWGYSLQGDGGTVEYNVAHPRWRVSSVARAELHCDVGHVYGSTFEPFLKGEPASAFLAEGSAVQVSRGRRLVP